MVTQQAKLTPAEKPPSRHHKLEVETLTRETFKDITPEIEKLVESSGIREGVCHIFVMHTTAAVLINENDDPAFTRDLSEFLARLAPRDHRYHHNDGNCDAHLKASLIGSSKTLLVESGRLVLGRWQGIYLAEFDGPRRRGLRVKIVAD
ncbi:MAG TPA: secondary thiamine-phosphate synthase enzyme YjbQ [Terriglobia bacterium]|nr:secondary thiamine-phosphate synthase enzyme YjbQ [Terriglobia bacterium]